MPDAMQTSRILRFEAFEVNLTTGELRKGGVRTRLAEQPFQILSALLERRGKLVTREALRERLWSDDTFVDFDRSLNIAVVKIREAGGRLGHRAPLHRDPPSARLPLHRTNRAPRPHGVESRTGAGALDASGVLVPFPVPAHRTGRADFPHPALRPASSLKLSQAADPGVSGAGAARLTGRTPPGR